MAGQTHVRREGRLDLTRRQLTTYPRVISCAESAISPGVSFNMFLNIRGIGSRLLRFKSEVVGLIDANHMN